LVIDILEKLVKSRQTLSKAMMARNGFSTPRKTLHVHAAHHGVVTSDWLAQAQAASQQQQEPSSSSSVKKKTGSGSFDVIDEFEGWRKQADLAEAVAAIRALSSVIRFSQSSAMMELIQELQSASDALKASDKTSISLTAGCDLFMRYVTRTSAVEYEDFNSAKSRFLERAEKFGEISYKARKIIAMLGQDFISNGCTILVHGFSRVVLEILKTAAESKKVFRVLCTEGRPDRSGLRFANELAKLDVPVKLLIDSAVAYSMDEVDMVFVGADGVVESGGIINMMGTYQIALVAKSMDKPVYVAAESYKFARLYPLDQKDMVPALRPVDFGVPIPSKVEVERSARDYTPPQYLTLLFTDLGVLTPSVVRGLCSLTIWWDALILQVASSPDPSSPKLSCIGQIKKRSNTTSNTNNLQRSNTSKSATNINYTKLLKLFSSKNLICKPVDNATISNDGVRSKRFNRSVTIPISSSKKHVISIEELDPPLPVVKLKPQDQEMNVNLGKRRGIELKTLQIQPVQLSKVVLNNSKSLAQQQDRSARISNIGGGLTWDLSD
ncbi:translation initiation factor eIF-2B subunit alpha-like protein, partial [Tanacetum coccineum]